MAGYRQIHPEIWSDPWFSELDTKEKIVFIYLFSNDRSSLCGLYEISIKQIAFDTGCEVAETQKIIDRFVVDKKIVFENNTILVKNMWEKHRTTSEKVMIRVKRDIAKIVDCKPKRVLLQIYSDIDALSIPPRYPIDTKTHEDEDENQDESLNENQNEVEVKGVAANNNAGELLLSTFCEHTKLEIGKDAEKIALELSEKGVTPQDIIAGIKYINETPKLKCVEFKSVYKSALIAMNKRLDSKDDHRRYTKGEYAEVGIH
jgi:hypothetical protein